MFFLACSYLSWSYLAVGAGDVSFTGNTSDYKGTDCALICDANGAWRIELLSQSIVNLKAERSSSSSSAVAQTASQGIIHTAAPESDHAVAAALAVEEAVDESMVTDGSRTHDHCAPCPLLHSSASVLSAHSTVLGRRKTQLLLADCSPLAEQWPTC